MDVAHFYGCKPEQRAAATCTSGVTVSVTPAATTGGGESVARPGYCDTPPSKFRKLLPDTERCLLEPDRVWRVFPRQQMAFDFAKSCQQDVAVFAFETEELGAEGKRKYLVTTYYELGRQYFSAKSPRHYYEVITEGSACHLYFDLEFKLEQNPRKLEPIALLETFIKYVCYQLYCQFGLYCDRTHILDLDSTTKQKFSRHLIFHLPGAVFRNNIHVGNFVHHICDQLRSLKQQVASGVSPQQARQLLCGGNTEPGSKTVCPQADCLLALFVLNEKNEKILFCDEGVYTRNRNFRLFLSTKLGKEARLTVARENKFKSSYGESMKNRKKSQLFNILVDSLVCNVRYERSARVLEFESPNSRQKRKRLMSSDKAHPASTEEGYSHSPYPRVDQFITSQLTRGGVQGSLRRWTYFPQGKLLVYDIQHNRWCENIGRAHKSNNIMMIADLCRGVYFQKCHDPDCKRIDFRSQEYEIPPQFNPMSTQFHQDAKSGIMRQLEDDAAQDMEESILDEEFFEKSAAELNLCESEFEPPCVEWTGSSKYDLLSDEQFLERLATTDTDIDFGPVTQGHEGLKRDEDSDDNLFAGASKLKIKDFKMAVVEAVTGEWTDSPGNHKDSCERDSLFNRALSEYESTESRPMAQPKPKCHESSITKTASTNVKGAAGFAEPGVFDLSLEEVKAFCEDGD